VKSLNGKPIVTGSVQKFYVFDGLGKKFYDFIYFRNRTNDFGTMEQCISKLKNIEQIDWLKLVN
jgi:hypothetical protein